MFLATPQFKIIENSIRGQPSKPACQESLVTRDTNYHLRAVTDRGRARRPPFSLGFMGGPRSSLYRPEPIKISSTLGGGGGGRGSWDDPGSVWGC